MMLIANHGLEEKMQIKYTTLPHTRLKEKLSYLMDAWSFDKLGSQLISFNDSNAFFSNITRDKYTH